MQPSKIKLVIDSDLPWLFLNLLLANNLTITGNLRSWMIVPPVRNWFGSVRSDVFTNRWFVIGTRFGYLVRSYLVRYVVRKFGTKLFGSVRGTKTWYEVIWFGTWYENLVRSYLVRSEIGDFSVPIWYEPLIWFGTNFTKSRTTVPFRTDTFI